MPQKLNITELDYDKIRSNLKSYFTREGSVFRDWDFEGSGLSNLLDVLAYNTHYNAMLAHMTLNEGFIDTAQLRESVVSHAKLLGYTPRSKRAATATISVFFPSSNDPVDQLTLPRGTKFKTSFNGNTYTFVTTEAATAKSLTYTQGFGYLFSELPIAQGILRRVSYLVDSNVDDQRFVITDPDVDTATMKVFVRENVGSTLVETFVPFASLAKTDSTSAIYFLFENYAGKYEVRFGDGIFGKKLNNLQVVELEFISTLGKEVNGSGGKSGDVGNWEYVTGALDPDAISGDIDTVVTTILPASGGNDKEEIESVRFNAPLSFIAQNRAVTANDYISLIQKEFGSVDAINVWGGEDSDPITPSGAGKVYVSIKPHDDILENGEIITRAKLSESDKNLIRDILETKRVITLKTEFVDPDYTYIYMDVFLKFNPNKTSETRKEIEANVYSNVISPFRETQLQKFNGVFRYSKFLSAIDSYNSAFLNSFARIYLYKIYDPFTYEWLNATPQIQRVRFVDADNKLYFDTYTNLNLVTGMRFSVFNIAFEGESNISLENQSVTVETDYSFSIPYSSLTGDKSTIVFGSGWINRAGELSANTIDFSGGIYRDQDKSTPLLDCSSWSYRYNGSGYPLVTGGTLANVKLVDVAIADDSQDLSYGKRNVYLRNASTEANIYSTPVGYLDVARGIILLDKPITNIPNTAANTASFRIDVVPDSNDIAPKRNQLLDIALKEVSVTAEVDTIAVGGSSGSIKYTTFKKHRNLDDETTVIN